MTNLHLLIFLELTNIHHLNNRRFQNEFYFDVGASGNENFILDTSKPKVENF